MGLWANWSSGRCPCPWQGGWNEMIFKAPSNPNGSMILRFLATLSSQGGGFGELCHYPGWMASDKQVNSFRTGLGVSACRIPRPYRGEGPLHWKLSRPRWMGLCAAWSSWTCAWSLQGSWARWPLNSLPTQSILWFYDMHVRIEFWKNCRPDSKPWQQTCCQHGSWETANYLSGDNNADHSILEFVPSSY